MIEIYEIYKLREALDTPLTSVVFRILESFIRYALVEYMKAHLRVSDILNNLV